MDEHRKDDEGERVLLQRRGDQVGSVTVHVYPNGEASLTVWREYPAEPRGAGAVRVSAPIVLTQSELEQVRSVLDWALAAARRQQVNLPLRSQGLSRRRRP